MYPSERQRSSRADCRAATDSATVLAKSNTPEKQKFKLQSGKCPPELPPNRQKAPKSWHQSYTTLFNGININQGLPKKSHSYSKSTWPLFLQVYIFKASKPCQHFTNSSPAHHSLSKLMADSISNFFLITVLKLSTIFISTVLGIHHSLKFNHFVINPV